MSQQAKKEQAAITLQVLSARAKIVKDAREYGNKGFQWTRRVIALTAVFAVIVLPKLAAIFYPEVGVVVGYTEFHPGLFFIPDRESTEWVPLIGLVITPLDTHLVSAIAGLYFGASITSNRN